MPTTIVQPAFTSTNHFYLSFIRRKFPFKLLLILFCFSKTGFCQEIIVKLSEQVEVSISKGDPTNYFSNRLKIKNILSKNPPKRIQKLFQKQKNNLPSFLRNVQLWQFQHEQESKDVLASLREIEGVIYAEPNHAYKATEIPNDIHYSDQWYLPEISAPEAWEIEKGKPSVIVGVIDTGIDYTHEDLRQQIWINPAEDLNGNGKLDSTDINQVDDDSNGYIDDVVGWDFTHAPDFPDDGDFLDPDNDPMDEFFTGHGTPIAGIIAAEQNNQIGISGLAPNIKVMALRAGTASGFLEEDDVAEAIVYAVDNGCRIINMSFGDDVFSYLIHDAIQYGISKGALFVAASGNSGNAILNYPAAYDETISVGATTSSNGLAGFSSYGSKLNLVAPGQEIFSCQIDQSYGLNNGTSFSAPIVSAAAALVWSHYPNYSPEKVKGALLAGCMDLGVFGWDIYYGHGLLNINRSLSISNQGYAEICKPSINDGIATDEVSIIGTVFGPNIISYSLNFGVGESPNEWSQISKAFATQVLSDTLAVWNTAALADTIYTLELALEQYNLPNITYRTHLYIDHTPSVLDNLATIEMMVGDASALLIQFETDDPTLAVLHYGMGGSNQMDHSVTSQYFQKHHYFLLSQDDIAGAVDYYLEIKNSSGLTSLFDNDGDYYHLTIRAEQPVESIYSYVGSFPLSGYFLPYLTDFNVNQRPEIVISHKLDSIQYGELQIWELENQQFQLKTETGFPAIPRDAQDIEGNGSLELLAGYGGASMILEKSGGSQFPNDLAWIDTANIWGSRLVNLDQDSTLELLAIKNGEWAIFDLTIPGYQPALKQQLVNPTAGNNRYGIPNSISADLDNDGLQEIIVGDYDGDIMIFEENGAGEYQPIWWQRLAGEDATNLLQAGDVNGDGKTELIAVVRNEPENLTESNAIARYWNMSIWQAQSDNNFIQIWKKNFHGVNSQRTSFNGLQLLDINENSIPEIYFAPFPKIYQIQYSMGDFEIGWYQEGINTNSVLQLDFDANGKKDLLLGAVDGIRRYAYNVAPNRPLPPAHLTATALDTDAIRLNWSDIPAADYYNIYRKNTQPYFIFLDSTSVNVYIDSAVSAENVYSYAVTQFNLSYPQSESQYSNIATAQPNAPPLLNTLFVSGARQLLMRFNEPLSDQSFDPNYFRLLPQNRIPISAVRGHNRQHIILSFKNDFSAGQNELRAYHLTNYRGTPIKSDSLIASFLFSPASNPFYLKKAEFISKTNLRLIFSNPVKPEFAEQPENYSLMPDGKILEARVDTINQAVDLIIDKNNRMGSLGIPYYIEVQNLQDRFGNALDSALENRLIVTRSSDRLDQVIAYPNPYRVQNAPHPMRFGNIPLGSEIFIYSAQGQFIRELKEKDEDGGVVWDLKTSHNGRAGSGVYFYVVKFKDEEFKGKFIIVN